MENKNFKILSDETLETIQGGFPSWGLPLLPNYDQLLGSLCGLIDGLTGAKKGNGC